jgi:hypothetical protein
MATLPAAAYLFLTRYSLEMQTFEHERNGSERSNPRSSDEVIENVDLGDICGE